MKKLLLTGYCLLVSLWIYGQATSVVGAEYFIDMDPGVGNAAAMTVSTPGATVTVSDSFSTTGLATGFHRLYIRTKDDLGKWSLAEGRTFYIYNNPPALPAGASQIVKAEYFIDTDPGVNNGTEIPDLSPNASVMISVGLPTTGFTPGFHWLYIRTKDDLGKWSLTEGRTFYIYNNPPAPPAGASQIVKAEYFIDTDPGVNNGTEIPDVTPGATVTLSTALLTSDMPLGVHYLYIRTKDNLGKWSLVERRSFTSTCPTISIAGGTTICQNSSTTLTATVSGDTLTCNLQWEESTDGVIFTPVSGANALTYLAAPLSMMYYRAIYNCPVSGCLLTSNVELIDILPELTFYADADGDGYGAGVAIMACEQPINTKPNNDDCDDSMAAVNPVAQEICNGGIDDDCDGLPDDADGSVTGQNTYYTDSDTDGYGTGAAILSCVQPANTSNNNADCNDGNMGIHPGAQEVCNALADDDCDGDADDADGSVTGQNTYYADSDTDGYGAGAAILACIQPANTSNNNTDCNDGNMDIHPGAIEICNNLDDDCNGLNDDGVTYPIPGIIASSTTICGGTPTSLTATGGGTYQWSTGATSETITVSPNSTTTYEVIVTNSYQCTAVASQTVTINNNPPTLDFVGTAPFDGHAVDPIAGGPYTLYTFRIKYTDEDGDAPDNSFPRLILNYLPNGASGNDLNLTMTELPEGDFITGKIYEVQVTGLPVSSEWNAHFVAIDENGCLGSSDNTIPLPLVEPIVFDSLDIYVYANDITFSDYSPDVNQTVTAYSTIHNPSDFPSYNFVARLHNDFTGLDIGTQITSIAPHSSVTLNWTVTMPEVPSWNPIHIYADDTDLLYETYENNNNASRPLVVGNFPLPGEIVTTASANDIPFNVNACITMSGYAYYSGLPSGLMLNNTGVAGATVIFWIVGGNDTLETTTNSNGQFYYSSAFCSPPLGFGSHTINGIVTDFSLVDTFSITFNVYQPPIGCNYPDLVSFVSGPTSCILPGDIITYNVRVQNNGMTDAVPSTLKITPSSNLTSNSPIYVSTPSLVANGGFYETTVTYTMPGAEQSVSITAQADFYEDIPLECYNSNNASSVTFSVQPDLPDLAVSSFNILSSHNICQNNAFQAILSNGSCVTADTSHFTLVVTEVSSGITWSQEYLTATFPAASSQSFAFPDLWPSVFPNTGNYQFDFYLDTYNHISEINENNHFQYFESLFPCEVDLVPDCGFARDSYVIHSDGNEANFDFPIRIHNYGLSASTTDFQVNVEIMDNNVSVASTSYIETADISSGDHADHMVSLANVVPCLAGHEYRLRITTDVLDVVGESIELNNICDDPRLFKDYLPIEYCNGINFWNDIHLPGVAYPIYCGVRKRGDFKDNSLKVRFEVKFSGDSDWTNVGTATIGPLESAGSDGCPQFNAVTPFPYTFPSSGAWQLRITTDPLDEICESDESNNFMIRNFEITQAPDLVTYSQWINPDSLNPQPGQLINVDVTYKNVGDNILPGQLFTTQLWLDNTLVGLLEHPLPGLLTGDVVTITFNNVQIPSNWIPGGPAELHILRAIVDADNLITEVNELNNEATRAIVIGLSPDDSITVMAYANSIISTTVENFGSGPESNGTLNLFYIDNLGQEFPIPGAQNIPIGALAVGATQTINFGWAAVSNASQIIARISNVTPLDYNILNNESSINIQTAPSFVTFRLLNQNGEIIPESQFELQTPPGGIILQGGSVVLSAGAYSIRIYPGINGSMQGGELYREETFTINGSSQNIDFEWKTAPFTVNLVDQDSIPIPSSQYNFTWGDILAGNILTLPVTEDPDHNTILGTDANGYRIKVYPGINGILQGGLLYRTESPYELEVVGNTYSPIWEVGKGTLHLVDINGNEVCMSLIDHIFTGTISTGSYVVFPISDFTIYPNLQGNYGGGYFGFYLKPNPTIPIEGPFTFNLTTGGIFEPAFITIAGNQYGLRFNLPPIQQADPDADGICATVDNCSMVSNSDQANNDGDVEGDSCDMDDDNDGYLDSNDCQPFNPAIHPGATEICNSGIDDDCDALADNADPSVTGQNTYYADNDSDVQGNPLVSQMSCTQPTGYVSNNTDCDDNNPQPCPRPTATSTSAITDISAMLSWNGTTCANRYRLQYREITSPSSVWIDVYVYETNYELTGLTEGTRYQWRVGTVCSPTGTSVPGGFTVQLTFKTLYRVYPDVDIDGYGSSTSPTVLVVSFPLAGYSLDHTDCDDNVSTTHPGSMEVCNNIDDDCNLLVDDNITDLDIWYQDADGDGLGNPLITISNCNPPNGYVSNNIDCDDNNSTLLCAPPTNGIASSINATSAIVAWTEVLCALRYTMQYRRIYPNGAWSAKVNVNATTTNLTGLMPNTTYQVRVRSLCPSPNPTTSGWLYITFTTQMLPMGLSEGGSTSGNAVTPTDVQFDIYPNPGDGLFNLSLSCEIESEISITVLDGLGRLLYSSKWHVSKGQNFNQLNLNSLSEGVYLVKVQQGDMSRTKKIVIIR